MDKRKQTFIVKAVALTLAFILIITAAVALCYRTALKLIYPLKEVTLVESYATQYNLEPALLYAIIKTESGFNPDAKSDANALGLTQITPQTFQWLQTKTGETLPDTALLEADVSVQYGAIFLRMLLDEFGNTKTAVAAYHAGRGSVNKWLTDAQYSTDGKTLDTIPSRDTAHYVGKVITAMNIYKNLYQI